MSQNKAELEKLAKIYLMMTLAQSQLSISN